MNTGKTSERDTRQLARIDMESFLSVCSVKNVNLVVYPGGYTRAYVNIEVNAEHPGFNFWEKDYGDFLRSLMEKTAFLARVFWNPGKTAVNMNGRRSMNDPETTIFFERV